MKKMTLCSLLLLAGATLGGTQAYAVRTCETVCYEDAPRVVKKRVLKEPRKQYIVCEDDEEIIVCNDKNNNSSLLSSIAAAPVYVGLGVIGLFGIKAIIGVGGLLLGAI